MMFSLFTCWGETAPSLSDAVVGDCTTRGERPSLVVSLAATEPVTCEDEELDLLKEDGLAEELKL